VPGGLLRQGPVTDPEALLRIAVDAATEAGRLLASWRGDERPEVVDTKSSPTDVVTEMDRRSEALITQRIRAVRPGDTVLGEEGGQTTGGRDASTGPGGSAGPRDRGDTGRVRWVVDPLDGTVNYLYGLPDWAVSIAAEVDGIVLAGVVEVPRFGETFTATAGQGAWLHRDGSPRTAVSLRCTRGVALGQALVATGFGYDPRRRRVQGEVVAALLPHVRDIRRGGSAAVDLCSVAAGRMDAFYERGLNYWDYAAGSLIAREAGAVVGGLSGRAESTSMTVAAGPDLYLQLNAFLTSLDPERDAVLARRRRSPGDSPFGRKTFPPKPSKPSKPLGPQAPQPPKLLSLPVARRPKPPRPPKPPLGPQATFGPQAPFAGVPRVRWART
jgi:myo-inositol-1(or 4)-monophosphatase